MVWIYLDSVAVATPPSACAGIMRDAGVNDEVTKRHVNGPTHFVFYEYAGLLTSAGLYMVYSKPSPQSHWYRRGRVIKSDLSVIHPDYHKLGYHLFSHNAP
jgi:hypothetical protein